MQNVIKIYYVVNSYEHFHELLQCNGRTSGRTQIVIIVQTQGSCNSSILKSPILSSSTIFPAFRDSVAGMNESFICINDSVTRLSQLPDHAKVSDPTEDYILSLNQHFLLYMKGIFAKTTLAASVQM